MKKLWLTGAGLILLTSLINGQTPVPPPAITTPTKTAAEPGQWEVGVDVTAETLSNGFAPWYNSQLQLKRSFASGQAMYGIYRETSRFALRDRETSVGFRQPFGRGWAATLEASLSPTHQVLPKWTAFAQLERTLGRGWVAQAGYRFARHNLTTAHLGIATVERYFRRYRVGYTLYAGAAANTGVSRSHRVAGDYYYGERSSVGVGFAAGKELTQLNPRTILRAAVRDVSLYGRHAFNARWNLNYSLTWHEQGSLYVRRGINVGLQYRF